MGIMEHSVVYLRSSESLLYNIHVKSDQPSQLRACLWYFQQVQGWFKVHTKNSIMALTPSPPYRHNNTNLKENTCSLEVSPK